tara:strand:- start:242 stop:571 length:330 start_codon:yes stop_codon:yes gene_type:complete
MIFLKYIIIYLISLLIINLPNPQSAKSGKINNLINKICIRNFNLEIQKTKSSLSSEAGNQICKCFVKELQRSASLKRAKSICIEKILGNTYEKAAILAIKSNQIPFPFH